MDTTCQKFANGSGQELKSKLQPMNILVFNAGSSTLKFALFDASACKELAAGVIDWQGTTAANCEFHAPGVDETRCHTPVTDNREAVTWILARLDEHVSSTGIHLVGHRIVHGGTKFTVSTLIDDQVIAGLERISELAPLHNPPALTALAAARAALPEARHVAVFDTAFFASMPLRSIVYPVPFQWFEQFGIRRFGFHGISHAYCARRAAELLDIEGSANKRLVICHLGNGCSATAIRSGQPIATTMGFTPLDGLMMGTRSGAIDPGILLHLVQHHGMQLKQMDESLNRQSGLLGVSGVSSDFRVVASAASAGNPRAKLAIDMFADRIRATIGALTVTLGGIDALIFTAGIGANSAVLRSRVCDGLQCLNLELDEEKNQQNTPESDVACRRSAGRILLIRTREEQAIAQACARSLNQS
jgi:acetate kinase